MDNEAYLNLGKNFHAWHKGDKLKFIVSPESKAIHKEIERVSDLIEYVKEKRKGLKV